ncbi:MAG: LysR family transcriptional regulator [Nocardioides sp.]
MLDPTRLRVFRAVVATGSVAAAAGNLDYTPSAVSQHLQALQRETGLVLSSARAEASPRPPPPCGWSPAASR